MDEAAATPPVEAHSQEMRARMMGYIHICMVIVTLTSIILYTSTEAIPDLNSETNLEPQRAGFDIMYPPKAMQIAQIDPAMPNTKVYLHNALTLARTNFNLANLAKTVNIEPSRILGVANDSTLRWTSHSEKALNFAPHNKLYGLTGLYVTSFNGNEKVTAMLRMPREVCQAQTTSWTCQSKEENKHFDNTHCVVIIAASTVNDVLDVAKVAAETQKINLNEPVIKGAFCGNPLLQRIAAGYNSVFFLNRKQESEGTDRDYMLCKYNTETMELSQCTDIGTKYARYNKPMALIYDAFVDAVFTLQYDRDRVPSMLAFDGQVLNPKTMINSFPSPSGFFLHSESFDGNIVFHGDLSIYEVECIVNLESGRVVTIRPI